LLAVNDVRAPTYYNINDTRYYHNYNDSQRFGSHNGYIDIGPKNNQTCHIYTDRPSFYFNQILSENGRRVLTDDIWINNKYFGSDGVIYSTRFYDTNDSSYYCDPSTDSRFLQITVGVGGSYSDIFMKDDESNSGANRIHSNSGIIGFLRGDGGQWFLYSNGSGAFSPAYNVTSDYRVKINHRRVTGALAIIAQLEEIEYERTDFDNPKTEQGWLAHKVKEVYPFVVTGEKDAIKKDGTPDLQAIDYGRMTPLLSAGIKELMAEVAELRAQIQALQGA
jgi:hypothetical protein